MNDPVKPKVTMVGTKIRRWRKLIPLKSFELAQVLKISQGTLSEIENNKSLPSADTLAKFHTNTNINILWLLTGKGPMTKQENPDSKDREFSTDPGEGNESAEPNELENLVAKLIRAYRLGDVKRKALLKGFIEGIDPEPF